MKKCLFFYLLLLLFSPNLNAFQNPESVEESLSKAAKIFKTGQEEKALIIITETLKISKKNKDEDGIIKSSKMLMRFYGHTKNHKKVIEIAEDLEKLVLPKKDYLILSDLYMTKAVSYEILGFYKNSEIEFKKAIRNGKLIKNEDQRNYKLSMIYDNYSILYESKNITDSVVINLKKSRFYADKIIGNEQDISIQDKLDMLVSLDVNIGIFYMYLDQNPKLDSAQFYLEDALDKYKNKQYELAQDTKLHILTSLAELNYFQKKYKNSIDYSLEALDLEKKIYKMPHERKIAYEMLAKSYLAIKNNENANNYLNLFTQLNDSLVKSKKNNIETPTNQLLGEKKSEEKNSFVQKSTLIIGIGFAFFLAILSAITIYWKRKNKKLNESYSILINKINQPTEENFIEENSTIDSGSTISQENYNLIIKKLNQFEKSEKFLNKNISLTWLANKFNVNPKQISEIIKNEKNTNFHGYINSLRISYITKKLYLDTKFREYKISYLAEHCGYSSSQVFVNAFKKETGITPSYFLKALS